MRPSKKYANFNRDSYSVMMMWCCLFPRLITTPLCIKWTSTKLNAGEWPRPPNGPPNLKASAGGQSHMRKWADAWELPVRGGHIWSSTSLILQLQKLLHIYALFRFQTDVLLGEKIEMVVRLLLIVLRNYNKYCSFRKDLQLCQVKKSLVSMATSAQSCYHISKEITAIQTWDVWEFFPNDWGQDDEEEQLASHGDEQRGIAY